MKISGTYDVVLIPVLLPIQAVLSLLPQALRSVSPSPLIPFTPSQIAALGLSGYDASLHHPILLQLGYQHNSGLGPSSMGMDFEEAKLEVLGVRHPLNTKAADAGQGYVYKQMTVFASRMMALSSRYIAGLRSETAIITPQRTPSCFGEQERSLEYNVKDRVEASFTASDGEETSADPILDWTGKPWFGWNTSSGNTTKFDFDKASMPFTPIPLLANLRLRPSSFVDPFFKGDLDEGWLEFSNLKAWRVKMSYVSYDSNVQT